MGQIIFEYEADGSTHTQPCQGEAGQTLLDIALDNGIEIEHTCGGVGACATCHVYVTSGMDQLTTADDDEEDVLDMAAAVKPGSRLACRAVVTGDQAVTVRIPTWNRNAIRETPH